MPSYAGQMIKMLRESKNMSQQDLGERLGVGRAAVNKYEKGVVENIPLRTVEKIADIFEINPAQILGWDDSNYILSYETRIIRGVKHFYSEESVSLLETFVLLSKVNQKKAISYINDLHKLQSFSDR